MKAYLVRRFFYALFVLLGVSVIVFLLVRLTGDPAALMMPLDATDEDIARLRRALGFPAAKRRASPAT